MFLCPILVLDSDRGGAVGTKEIRKCRACKKIN